MRRLRIDPVVVIAAVTVAAIGFCLTGVAARMLLGAATIPIRITEPDEDNDR